MVESDAFNLKEEGNILYRKGDLEGAREVYSRALRCAQLDAGQRSDILRNRAAVHLKLEDHTAAVADCTQLLEQCNVDAKALYRRSIAYEKMANYASAYRDASQLLSIDPRNKDVQTLMSRLHVKAQQEVERRSGRSSKVEQVFKYLFNTNQEQQKRIDCAANLLVLAKETDSADLLVNLGVVDKLKCLFRTEQVLEIRLQCVRAIRALFCVSTNCFKLLDSFTVDWLMGLLGCDHADVISCVQFLLQSILNLLSGMKMDSLDSEADSVRISANSRPIDAIFSKLVISIDACAMQPLARDAVLQLTLRNFSHKRLNKAMYLVEQGGLIRMLQLASVCYTPAISRSGLPPSSSAPSHLISVSADTGDLVSVCISTLYDDMPCDVSRASFHGVVEQFVKDKLLCPDMDSKMAVVLLISALMRSAIEVGNKIIAREGILEMIMAMASSSDIDQQRVACEALISVANKPDKCKSIVTQGACALKQLYQSSDERIRVRALVGLCKIGSFGGSDCSVRPFADGATCKLADSCRRFLINPGNDTDLCRWATEGLSYLTLDAEVKEKLIEDGQAIRAIIELAKTEQCSVQYGVVTTLVNLTNSYDKQEMLPEMLELAKFAKQHVPEEHELDDEEFVCKRVEILVKANVTTALVVLAQTESKSRRELVSRVFNAISSRVNLRGTVVQQGGAKALLKLTVNNTKNGCKHASQALSRLAVSIDPNIAFPGQRAYELIRPMLSLLHPECQALENFEALLALCNIAGMNNSVRQRMVKEKAISHIEQYMYEEHVMLRRAATQCINNLAVCREYVTMCEGENDRLKFLLLLMAEEDVETALAAAGSLAMITELSDTCCEKMMRISCCLEMCRVTLASSNDGLRHRGVVVLRNMIFCSRRLAEQILETDIRQLLMAICLLPPDGEIMPKIQQVCRDALDKSKEYKLTFGSDTDSDIDR